MAFLDPQDYKFLVVVLAFMVLSALLTLEIEHGFPLDRGAKPVDGEMSLWVDLSLREPEPVGFSFSTRRESRPVQRPQKTTREIEQAGAGQR